MAAGFRKASSHYSSAPVMMMMMIVFLNCQTAVMKSVNKGSF